MKLFHLFLFVSIVAILTDRAVSQDLLHPSVVTWDHVRPDKEDTLSFAITNTTSIPISLSLGFDFTARASDSTDYVQINPRDLYGALAPHDTRIIHAVYFERLPDQQTYGVFRLPGGDTIGVRASTGAWPSPGVVEPCGYIYFPPPTFYALNGRTSHDTMWVGSHFRFSLTIDSVVSSDPIHFILPAQHSVKLEGLGLTSSSLTFRPDSTRKQITHYIDTLRIYSHSDSATCEPGTQIVEGIAVPDSNTAGVHSIFKPDHFLARIHKHSDVRRIVFRNDSTITLHDLYISRDGYEQYFQIYGDGVTTLKPGDSTVITVTLRDTTNTGTSYDGSFGIWLDQYHMVDYNLLYLVDKPVAGISKNQPALLQDMHSIRVSSGPGSAKLFLASETAMPATIEIWDAVGRMRRVRALTLAAGANVIDLSDILGASEEAGVYWCRIRAAAWTEVVPVNITR